MFAAFWYWCGQSLPTMADNDGRKVLRAMEMSQCQASHHQPKSKAYYKSSGSCREHGPMVATLQAPTGHPGQRVGLALPQVELSDHFASQSVPGRRDEIFFTLKSLYEGLILQAKHHS